MQYKVGDIFRNTDNSYFIIYEIVKSWPGIPGGYHVNHISNLNIAENSKLFPENVWNNRIENSQLIYVRNIFE